MTVLAGGCRISLQILNIRAASVLILIPIVKQALFLLVTDLQHSHNVLVHH